MNSSFPNRWSFSYLKFTKYVTNPGSANDAVSKRFLYKRIQNLTNDHSLENVSGYINSIKNEIAELRQSLLCNRKSIQEKSMSLLK